MTVPRLRSDNFEDFGLDLQGSARSKVGLSGIPLDYLFRTNDAGNYDGV